MSLPEVHTTADDAREHIERLGRIVSATKGIGELALSRARLELLRASEVDKGTIVVAPEGMQFELRFSRGEVTRGRYLNGNNFHQMTGLVSPHTDSVGRDYVFYAGRLEAEGETIIGISHDLQTACVVEDMYPTDARPALNVQITPLPVAAE